MTTMRRKRSRRTDEDRGGEGPMRTERRRRTDEDSEEEKDR